ncbi:MAG: cytochrome oxidase putative small subunit CydP [Methylophilaceae bacterium]
MIEIAVILIVKILLLWFIWTAFFSHPIPKDARQNATTRMILNQSK